MNKNKNIILSIILVILLTILWFIYTNINIFPMYDFVEYWAAGRINLNHGNPYDPDQMLAVEKYAGLTENDAVMMLNPPWTLAYSMFFGILDYPFSRFLCFIIQVSVIFVCSILLWKIYNGNKKYGWMSMLILFSFGPILRALQSGQVTIMVLLGIVGFLYFVNKKNDFWAGVLASLVFVKPHLIYLFLIALLFWTIFYRRKYVLLGLAVGILGTTVITWIVNPLILTQYVNMLKFYPLEAWITATLGSFLRLSFGPDKNYLQLVPAMAGIIWLIIYWMKHRINFDWTTRLPTIVLISIVTTPYGWTLDYSVIVVSIIQIISIFEFRHWTIPQLFIFIIYWVANFIMIFISLQQSWFWWFPSYILLWFLLASKYLPGNNRIIDKENSKITITST